MSYKKAAVGTRYAHRMSGHGYGGSDGKPKVTRVDHGREHGWLVRLQFVDGKPKYQKRFPDRRHGGREAALSAAESWRDEILKDIPVVSVDEDCFCSVHPDREKLREEAIKANGGLPVFVGTGREGVRKERLLGASKPTLSFVLRGFVDTVYLTGKRPKFEINGFSKSREITTDQYDSILLIVKRFADRRMSEVEVEETAQDILISISTQDETWDGQQNMERFAIFKTKQKNIQWNGRRKSRGHASIDCMYEDFGYEVADHRETCCD